MNEAYKLALGEIGVKEFQGGENPKILAYFKEAGFPEIDEDETAWCAAFVGAMLARAGIEPTGSLLARSYLDWGEPVSLADAQQGDIVVIPRGNSSWQGHVFFLHEKRGAFIMGLGGNQKNAVNIASFPVGKNGSKILGIRRIKAKPKPAFGVKQVAAVAGTGAGLAAFGLWDSIVKLFN